jgi:hypothetical protein
MPRAPKIASVNHARTARKKVLRGGGVRVMTADEQHKDMSAFGARLGANPKAAVTFLKDAWFPACAGITDLGEGGSTPRGSGSLTATRKARRPREMRGSIVFANKLTRLHGFGV